MISISCQAVFENGVLRPLSPPALREGEAVELIIVSKESETPGRKPSEIIAAIAALPVESNGDSHTGRAHDKYLYGSHLP